MAEQGHDGTKAGHHETSRLDRKTASFAIERKEPLKLMKLSFTEPTKMCGLL